MLNSKQRARLRGMANDYDALFQIGKGGINDNIIKQTADALEARELIKLSVLETAQITARECADTLSAATGSDVVQVIGRRFVLYKQSSDKDKRKIVL